jgi:hypothetical protein
VSKIHVGNRASQLTFVSSRQEKERLEEEKAAVDVEARRVTETLVRLARINSTLLD